MRRLNRQFVILFLLGLSSPCACAADLFHFVDVTESTGITFEHTDGSSGQRYIIESISGGVALLDYDGDDDLDIYFLNGAPLRGTTVEQLPRNALYRNDGNWKFTDVTEEAGVGDTGFGSGVAASDYDNDGDVDIYVNNVGPNVLYTNRGDGTFSDSSSAAGVSNGDRVGAGVSFFDMDGDGDLDLYAANYIQFSYESHKPHMLRGIPAYPSPLKYPPDPDTLFRNDGDGTFTDVSEESGIARHKGTGMGMVAVDYDDDNDVDLFVGNDVRGNFLFQNDGHGQFEEVALLSGTAYDLAGRAQASMGVDGADIDRDGDIDFHVTTYSGEFATLFRNLGSGAFEDATRVTSIGNGTLPHVAWGNVLADFDNDGWVDVFVACGDVDDNLHLRRGEPLTGFEIPNVLIRNLGGEKFENAASHSGPGFEIAAASRGAAAGDLDQDGDLDLIVQNSRSRPTVLENRIALQNWLQVRLVDFVGNRSAIGAKVAVTTSDGQQTVHVLSGRGYQSEFGAFVHFGLGQHDFVESLRVRWPDGLEENLGRIEANQRITHLREVTIRVD